MAVRELHQPADSVDADGLLIRNVRWALVAVGVQLLLIHLVASAAGEFSLRLLLPVSHLLVAPFLLANWRYWGVRLLAVGLVLNLAVMVANGGLMPVSASAVESVGRHEVSSLEVGSHIPGTKNVLVEGNAPLSALGDTVIVTLPSGTTAASPGDFVIVAGIAMVGIEIAALMLVRATAGTGRRRGASSAG